MLLVLQVGLPGLVHQHLGKGDPHRERVEHELALFLLFGGLADGNVGLRKMIAPFLVQLHEFVEFRLKIVHGCFRTFFRHGIKHHLFRRFGGTGRFGHFIGIAFRLVAQVDFFRRHFFQHGILLQFLFDERLEFEGGCLQQRQRLLELRRQHQRLRQAR